MSTTTKRHKGEAPVDITAAVITVSDSKFEYQQGRGEGGEEDEDLSGKLILEKLEDAGCRILHYEIVPDEEPKILGAVRKTVGNHKPDILITTGGTGISRRDVTIEALEKIFEKRLEGFGELFRALSFERIGNAAMLTRAAAGVFKATLIFALPGSPHAVETGMELISGEAGHLVKHLRE